MYTRSGAVKTRLSKTYKKLLGSMTLPDTLLLFFIGFFAWIAFAALRREKKSRDHYEELLAHQSRFIDTTRHITQGICIIDMNRQVAYLNPTLRSLLSLDQEDPHLSDILSSFPDPYAFSTHIDNALSLHRSSEMKDIPMRDKTIHLHIRPLKHTTGKVTGAAIILTDNAHERSAVQMKEDFTKVISHELRSPLTTIRAASQFIRMQDSRLTETERNRLLSMIDEQTDKLLYEVELILDAAKLEGREFQVQPLPGNLQSFLADTLPLLILEAQKKHITALIRMQPSLPEVAFDKKYLKQALNHIVSNSIKFTQPGGNILIDVQHVDDLVSITISDSGCGIPLEKQRTLFSRFSHISRPSENVGIGLGLYLTKGIIEAHGGSIMLDSDEGRGTTVTINLPLLPVSEISSYSTSFSSLN